ncbi:sulfotransferase family protein [Paenibacillus sepulcri]|uniref:Sulfotransferase n=1 Tax=Paenibacillus sepulcri TaxID=359917 RepID=A0ABS7BV53_9BACL|nr:sulfotransferase [Paenibacillus sepulcri]
MINNRGNNLIFLLCTPRSGSSLATVMLQNHSKVFATQEMWFLMGLSDLQVAAHRPYGGNGIIKQFYHGILPKQTFENASRAFSLQVYNGLLQSSGAEMLIDKSPRYYYNLEFIDSLFPQSKRIWLIRNPLSIISSYKKVNKHVNDRFNLKEDLLNPGFNIKMTDITVGLFRYLDYFSVKSKYAYHLRYEEMVKRPQAELQKLCSFLGLSYEEGLEKYGDFQDTAKSDLYYSMGVGDPFVTHHNEPHLDSLHSWKEILDKEEIEMYCRAIGAKIFHDLGYTEELEEAQRITGTTFQLEPDAALLQLRRKQLIDASGCSWSDGYQLRSDYTDAADSAASEMTLPELQQSVNSQQLQLQITLRSLERRLEKSYLEQRRLQSQLEATKQKIKRVKSMIPFGNQLSHLASTYLIGGKKR